MSLNFKRHDCNPLLGPDPNRPWGRDEARNPGVAFDGNTFHMVFTTSNKQSNPSDDMTLGYAKSTDGVHFEVNPEPFLPPSKNFDDFDFGTTEDTRITEFEGKFYIAYAGRSMKNDLFGKGVKRIGPNGNLNPTWTENFRRVGLAVTEDWKTVERLGPITSEFLSDANVAMFPEKINGKFAFLHRPTVGLPWMITLKYCPGAIWLCYSDEMKCCASDKREMPWDMVDGIDIPDDELLIKPTWSWEHNKMGGSGVPIPTDDGWLTFYHAVDRQGVYRVGLMMLDRQDPRKVIARCDHPVFEPTVDYETNGIRAKQRCYPSCVFPTANVVVGDDIYMYYGAQDLYCCLATVKLKEAIDYVMKYRV